MSKQLEKFSKLQNCRDRKSKNEHNDCSVKALALVCRVDYKTAHETMRKQGRKNRKGAYTEQSLDAIQSLGFHVEEITKRPKQRKESCYKGLRQANGSAYTPKTVVEVCDKGYYLIKIKGHVFACINGEIADWSAGRKHHVLGVWKVTRPRKIEIKNDELKIDKSKPAYIVKTFG